MKRLIVAVAAAALLTAVSAAATMAAPYEADDTPQATWGCPAWTGTFGNYDPATNPTLRTVAEKLGMSAADLSKELQAGKSVEEIANSKNVNLQVVVDALIAPQKEMMAIRQKYGFMTKEQADQALASVEAATKARLQAKGYFGGMSGGMIGGGMMRGGMMGGGMMGGGMMGGFGPRFAPNTATPGQPGAVAPGPRGGFGPGMMSGAWQQRTN